MKVLIVDDDERRASTLSRFLENSTEQSFSVVEIAGCTDQAKALLRSKYYDAMVVDVVLPKRVGELPSSANSIQLISQLSRQSFLKKPEKIIAITAHEDEIESFRSKFEEFCTAVVRAHDQSDVWRRNICNALLYTSFSKTSRAVSARKVAVFSVHGIRTYGSWQNRLQVLIQERTDDVSFYTYKYGYFSLISFLFPPLRRLEVNRLYARLEAMADQMGEARVLVFAHSFGTYLAAHTIKKIMENSTLAAEVCLVCSGSVLDENFDWSFARRHQNMRVVNDCGSADYILYMSKALALGLGMAGKIGFNGFNDPRFVNRWFVGGHSHYFEGDRFMIENWLPLLADGEVNCVDHRKGPSGIEIGLDGTLRLLGRLKPALYLIGIAFIGFAAWRLGA
jgi:CheY-like chemotaxis protein